MVRGSSSEKPSGPAGDDPLYFSRLLVAANSRRHILISTCQNNTSLCLAQGDIRLLSWPGFVFLMIFKPWDALGLTKKDLLVFFNVFF